MINGKRLDINVGVLKILVIVLIIYIAINLLFKYLIKSNKIKASKVSRIFYTDDEKFIINWEKNRKKGKLLYLLYSFMTNSLVFLVTYLFCFVVLGSDFNLSVLSGYLIGNLIGLPISWNRNEERYYMLLNNK
ncbi:hypothetical protein SAMN02746066_00234 [Anaerosporobacter mobilis DSM 15930]|uniref:Uncharacterized protein n=1 Tax=Anaerosporobacter mobilis DSM 15930 TaxID=1120996 RepID=A0A1M7EVU8_9FIRM|nr:hypothetical protein [Anaerosporobacter mobilis]SHL95952.1 hypothetical protein SAMN02746066_00234 [Anaerosporobacter mobilis DSM 15930]